MQRALRPTPITTKQQCTQFKPVSRPLRRPSIVANAASEESAPAYDYITVTLKKPLGLMLAEKDGSGEVFVEEITPQSNAAASGVIQVGDVVAKTSAVVLKAGKEGAYEKEGYGQRPYDNWEVIEFDCAGQTFDTVLAAIGSNNERWGINKVTLTLRRSKSTN